MSTYVGKNIKVEILGTSHGEEIKARIYGLNENVTIDEEKLQDFLDRRAPARGELSSPRKEEDKVILKRGAVLEGVIKNCDVRSQDYQVNIPRPGHSDYSQYLKYGEIQPGGGEFSGRMTAPMCIAGGIFKQLLEEEGISFESKIIDEEKMYERAKENPEDSVGGVVECQVLNLPKGLGGPIFDRLEADIARAVFSIPAVKGVEFGSGFKAANMLGSENNDPFYFHNGEVRTKGNNHGGVLGGVTTGMPLVVRVGIKPTPSISREQESINLHTGENCTIKIKGRHDACIVPRAVPCIEAAISIAIYDRMLSDGFKRR